MNNIIPDLIGLFTFVLYVLIIIRCALSWVPSINRDTPIVRLIYTLTEPILEPIRNLIHRSSFGSGMMIDFSPIIAILLIQVISSILIGFFK